VDKLETKTLPLKVDDLSKDSRTAVFAHASYDNIDRVGDICRPGMFDKSWKENKADIKFYVDHDPAQKPGIVLDVWETKAQALTKVKFGNYTLGNDMLEMVDMGVIDSASFGFKAIKSNKLVVKGKTIRELREVYHGESTLANGLPPINPLAKVVMVTKAGHTLFELKTLTTDEQTFLKKLIDGAQSNMEAAINFARNMDQTSDLYTWIMYYISRQADGMSGMRENLKWGSREMKAMKDHADKLENFCRNSKASDECIENILQEAKALNDLISQDDTAITHDDEPNASDNDEMTGEINILTQIKLLHAKTSLS
jgi:hypothetical protein